jgi:hypothetical protein
MSLLKKIFYLLLAIGGLFFMPYLGGYLKYDGQFPSDFFDFPALIAPPKQGFVMWVFVLLSVLGITFFLLYVFPSLFGFKPAPPTERTPKTKIPLPKWFWIGFVLWFCPFLAYITIASQPKWLVNWAVLPLLWGLALLLDGIVYVRNEGKSILSQYPQQFIGIGASSISGWMIFEFINFFVDDNWIYPFGNLIPSNEFLLYALLGSSGLMPVLFEVNDLLHSIRGFAERYQNGVAVSCPNWLKWIVLIFCYIGMFLCSYYPNLSFFTVWSAPLFILAITLSFLDIWTPFTPIKQGNWSPALLIGLSFLIEGFCMEGMNYLSAMHQNGHIVICHNPDYWQYSIPYVNVLHIFEMPLLGYMGYLSLGLYCMIWWQLFCFLLAIPPQNQKD